MDEPDLTVLGQDDSLGADWTSALQDDFSTAQVAASSDNWLDMVSPSVEETKVESHSDISSSNAETAHEAKDSNKGHGKGHED
jgi:hypothetical protein